MKDTIQMQRYINNPILAYGHKLDFRVHMLIASVNPLIVYYHDGFIRVSLQEYDLESKDSVIHFTNTHFADKIFEEARKNGEYYGKTEDELREFQTWNFTRLQDYLIEIGKIDDPKWLDNYLRPQFKRIMVHLIRSVSSSFIKKSNLFELWGLDFIMDDNLKLWFIEANPKPGIQGTSPMRKKLMETLTYNMLELMFGYLRSRMKRIVLYVNDLIKEFPSNNSNKIDLEEFDSAAHRIIFDSKININSMDPEFEPIQKSYEKIIDENLKGKNKYFGLITDECI